MSRRIRYKRWMVAGLGVAVLSIPAVAIAGRVNQRNGFLDGWYGYAVSQTKQQGGVVSQSQGYLDGWYGYAVLQAQQQQEHGVNQRYGPLNGRAYGYAGSLPQQRQQMGAVVDGRSPDTRDAAYASQQQSSTILDGRSPDTIDFAAQAHSPIVTVFNTPGFQWGDFGIGGGTALVAALLLLLSMRVVSNRRGGSTPVPTA